MAGDRVETGPPMDGPGGSAQGAPAGHYSYTLYEDPCTAASFDQRRFGGPIGTLLAESQERVLEGFLPDIATRTVIDVGAGTGRAALALARRGGRVTGIDASLEMIKVARQRAEAEGLEIAFVRGDAHALEFADRSFDAAVSLRVLMHTPDWRRCLGELCRVARERVVFDYPALRSVAALQALARRVVVLAGRPAEAYRVFAYSDIERELGIHGFRVADVHRQFVLPIAFHKRIGSRRFTERSEQALARAGLLRLFGSPVTIVARRCES